MNNHSTSVYAWGKCGDGFVGTAITHLQARFMATQNEREYAIHQKWLVRYLKLLAFTLVFTGVLKLGGSFSAKPYLGSFDPLLFFVSRRWVLIGAAIMEFACAVVILFSTPSRGLYVSSWLLLLFVLYRTGTYMLGDGDNICPCLGFWLPLKPETVNRISLGLLSFMLLGNVCGMAITYKNWLGAKLNPLLQTR